MTGTARERVLVVDDEPQVLVALEDLLGDDFDVTMTESAERALRVVEEDRDIAVVISDQRMPRMTGDELFKRLDGQSKATRILVTGFADLSAVIRAVNTGRIFGYVTKPWNPEDLRFLVQKGAEHFRLGRELAYERQLLHDLMENIPEGIFFKDRDLRFQRVNRAFAEMMNERESTVFQGKRLLELAPGNSEAATTEIREGALLSDGRHMVDVVRTVTHRGEPRWVSESKAPIRTPEGTVVGLVGIARDVTERVKTQEALRTSEERFQLVFLGSAAGLFDWNILDGEISYSPSFGLLMGHAGGEWSASLNELSELIHPEDVPRVKACLRHHFETRRPFNSLEVRARVRSGEYHWFLVSGQAVWDADGQATRLAGSITDITERKQQETRIARLTRIHAVLGGITSAIVRIEERDALMREACAIAVEVGRFTVAAAIGFRAQGQEVDMIAECRTGAMEAPAGTSAREANRVLDGTILRRIATEGRPIVLNDLADEGLGTTREGARSEYRALAVFPLMVGQRVDVAFALFSDVAGFFDGEELKLLGELAANLSFALTHIAQTKALDLLSYYDALTGLPNRDLLRDRMAQAIATARTSDNKVAVVLFDLERFRQVNETLGWPAGDELLSQVSRRLGEHIAPEHTLARCGSNCFALLVAPVVDETTVAQLVERLMREASKQAYSIESTDLRISLRTGIAVFPSDGAGPDALLGNAEAALKSARATGQRYAFYAPRMNARVAEKLDLETRLRRAIEQDEFLLHYQPKVNLKTGGIVGLEALIRWLEPSGTLVSPGQFIPVLEDTGLILDVGRWVIETAATQFATWVDQGLAPPRIAVNVSALQLAQEGFVASLDDVLRSIPRASEGIDLEITESVFVDDMTGNVEKLRAARARGLEVAIDDFGTGYSSLGYLSRLPIDALKIDRSFIIRMTENAQDMSIVTTIITLAHSLDLKVIAEGVETQEQARLLKLLRCDQLQGYLLARPQPAAEAALLLAARKQLL